MRQVTPKVLLFILTAVILGAVLSLWHGQGPLWRLVMLEERVHEFRHQHLGGELTREHFFTNRWTGRPIFRLQKAYYVESGRLSAELTPDGAGRTVWGPDGRVLFQAQGMTVKESPPWWWGVRDQR